MNFLFNKIGNKRRGVVMFVVLGAILVLGVLVSSYNFFVRGKFNESQEILMHLRASKCAQSVSSFVFATLMNDLQNIGNTSEGVSESAKALLNSFLENDGDRISEHLEKDWLSQTGYDDFGRMLLEGLIGAEDFDKPEVEFGVSDVHLLSELNSDPKVYFFPYEKIGRLTIRVTISIGRSREIWQETRPFKIVTPFPVPITKFSLYSKTCGTDELAFNTVDINAEDGSARANKPFVLDNGSVQTDGSSLDNVEDDVWIKRGWIYIGGGKLSLNRANGVKNFGQRYHSYPRPGPPATLLLNFPGGDSWDKEEYKYNGERLGFRIAHWGFSDALKDPNSSWQKILCDEFGKHPYETEKDRWQSSCLQLFSNVSVYNGGDDNKFVPTITRVVGEVNDRFLEMGYLLPVNSNSSSVFAAVRNYTDKDSYIEASNTNIANGTHGRRRLRENLPNNILPREDDYIYDDGALANRFPYENYLFFPGSDDIPMELYEIIKGYFEELDYMKTDDSQSVSYSKVMSKVQERSYKETYDVISNYSGNSNEISLPPKGSSPENSDDRFYFDSAASEKMSLGNLEQAIKDVKSLKISDIGRVDDTTLGLNLRTCYLLKGNSEEISNALLSAFGSNTNGFGLNLNNLVYKLESSDETANIGESLCIKSPGTIFSKGPIKIGGFAKTSDSDGNPLMVLAGKGSITIENNDSSEILAYLVALGDGGSVKVGNPNAKLCIRGGMAVDELSPDCLPKAGGYLAYNLKLDPTTELFNNYIGIALGPKGGRP